MSSQKNICAVDLFCGIGGLTYGMRKAGISVNAGVDNDSSCRAAYEQNNPAKFIHQDIQNITATDINPFYKDADVKVLVGCAPCQPFSAHTRKNRSDNKGDDCSLLMQFSRLIGECQPDVISLENVPGLARHKKFSDFLKVLDDLGYHYSLSPTVSCPEYGIPQTRKRLVMLASRFGEIKLIPPSKKWQNKKPTVAECIEGLPRINHGERSKGDHFHASLKLSAKNLERIKQSKPGGSWRDWDAKIVAKCHKNAYYPAPYGRMRWDGLAPTITTQFCYYSTGRFGHPEQHRAISLREGALLQTFPKSYKFQDKANPLTLREMARHIGNAVPVKLGKAIGQSIREHVYE